jgi:uncharacterized SAM-binding protein YcdF (DUF218 family)
MRKIQFILFLAVVLIGSFMATSGAFLVVNDPRKSDVIIVLGGDTDRRPARGFELLSQGFAPHLILNVPVGAYVYRTSELDLARQWIQGLPQAQSISLCPIRGTSTKAEAEEASRCLQPFGARRVLLVTSDFHTARALSIFKHRVPNYEYSMAASFDLNEFAPHWWQRREWAKTNFDEWLRRVWWELVDRWR